MVSAVPNAVLSGFAESEPAQPTINQAVIESDEAFSALIRITSPIIYRFMIRMVRSPEDAMDLTQDVFLAAHKSRAKFRVGEPALPYLLTVARRKAISLLRWRKVRSMVLPLTERDRDALEDRTGSPRDHAENKQGIRALESAVNSLRPAERAVVILRLFEERPYDEIARVVGKPVGTVKCIVFRAERKIRMFLESKGLQEL